MNIKRIEKKEFIQDLHYQRHEKRIRIFYDIETYQYNEKAGKKMPSKYKNCMYSFALSYFIKDDLKCLLLKNFKEFIDTVTDTLPYKKTPTFELIAHNCNKYDNHFLRKDLKYFFNIPHYNMYLKSATDEGNRTSIKLTEITEQEKQEGIILEKRIKSKNNLELHFFYKGITFITIDNWQKTNTSLKILGQKLERQNLIKKEHLKTDYNYIKFNQAFDMSEEQARTWAGRIFQNLNTDELTYIYNDVIILALSVFHYSRIFKGFDYEKITFTSNILESYNTSELTSWQLLHRIGNKKNPLQVDYTKYNFSGQNLYNYLKEFYIGGLNFYNYEKLGQIIEGVKGFDINSSYPHAMYNYKIPTFLENCTSFIKPTPVNIFDIHNDNFYTLYKITREEFDNKILTMFSGEIVKQMLVKYYGRHEHININTYTLKMIETITGLQVKSLKVLSYMQFSCQYFGSREKLADYYRIKTQAKNNYILDMEDINNIKITDKENNIILPPEEVEASKVNLNGLYGIPALRPYFNLFRFEADSYQNIINGYENNQRNILFSIFVTSVSVYNLLEPLQYLTSEEIDNNFLYCDTDSLYLKAEICHKLPNEMFNDLNIGKWGVQNEYIDYFYLLNHKKYAYEEKGKIVVKAGGVPNESFNKNLSFKEFIRVQFSVGAKIQNTKSIYTEYETIAIYESHTLLDKGGYYPTYSNTGFYDDKQKLFEDIREYLKNSENETLDDLLYIESTIGSFSFADVYEPEIKKGQGIDFYMIAEEEVKKMLTN